MDNTDLLRELGKVYDVLGIVELHFHHEALMNSALHMSATVRPAPLASAVLTAYASLQELMERIENADKQV